MQLDDLGALGRFLGRVLDGDGVTEIRIRRVGSNVEVTACTADSCTVVAHPSDDCTLSRDGKVRYTHPRGRSHGRES